MAVAAEARGRLERAVPKENQQTTTLNFKSNTVYYYMMIDYSIYHCVYIYIYIYTCIHTYKHELYSMIYYNITN